MTFPCKSHLVWYKVYLPRVWFHTIILALTRLKVHFLYNYSTKDPSEQLSNLRFIVSDLDMIWFGND